MRKAEISYRLLNVCRATAALRLIELISIIMCKFNMYDIRLLKLDWLLLVWVALHIDYI